MSCPPSSTIVAIRPPGSETKLAMNCEIRRLSLFTGAAVKDMLTLACKPAAVGVHPAARQAVQTWFHVTAFADRWAHTGIVQVMPCRVRGADLLLSGVGSSGVTPAIVASMTEIDPEQVPSFAVDTGYLKMGRSHPADVDRTSAFWLGACFSRMHSCRPGTCDPCLFLRLASLWHGRNTKISPSLVSMYLADRCNDASVRSAGLLPRKGHLQLGLW